MSSTSRVAKQVLAAMLLLTVVPVPSASTADASEPPAVVAQPPSAPAPAAPTVGGSDEAASFGEEIVVTGTRTPRPARDLPSPVTVMLRPELARSPTKTVDELLRVVPSFGLFRRSSSMVADPSSQGVNLRGIGPSGVSRSLVLVDGIPANDPFGGWVYWRGISRLDTERIEVAPGGTSALYGNYALGGVTQVFSRPVTSSTVEAFSEYGSFDTYLVGARVADRFGPVGATVAAEWLKSGGYAVVAPDARGTVDGDAPSQHATVNARLEGAASRELSFALRGGWFRETENGGTSFTTAAVKRFSYSGSVRYAPGDAGAFDLAVFGHVPTFEQQRARISAPSGPRSREDLAESQRVPAHDIGVGLRYTAPPLRLGGTHTLTLGSDVRRITGTLHDTLFPAALSDRTLVGRDSSGEQRLVGVFAQEVYDVTPALAVHLAVRYDRWVNRDATEVDRFSDRLGNLSTAQVGLAGRSDHQVIPKLGVRLRPLEWLTLRVAAYRAFRAPTLNELYRPFQVGLVVTQANPDLGPEKLRGAEAGFELAPLRSLMARVTGFWNEMDDPIVNVTTGTNLQQRQNLGQARIRGVEAEAAWRPRRSWLLSAGYTFAESRVTEAADPAQIGRDLPQDPRHRASFSLAFDDPRLLTAAVQVRYIGRQFEDDLNLRDLPATVLLDVSVSRRIIPQLEVVLGVENLLDEQYLVGRAGVNTVGQPRFIHGGLRLSMGGTGGG